MTTIKLSNGLEIEASEKELAALLWELSGEKERIQAVIDLVQKQRTEARAECDRLQGELDAAKAEIAVLKEGPKNPYLAAV